MALSKSLIGREVRWRVGYKNIMREELSRANMPLSSHASLTTISYPGGRRDGFSDSDRDDCSEVTFNHVRRLPHRVEHRELRIVYWSTLITLLRMAHVGRFPNRSFGKDL